MGRRASGRPSSSVRRSKCAEIEAFAPIEHSGPTCLGGAEASSSCRKNCGQRSPQRSTNSSSVTFPARRSAGEGTDDELVERWGLLWPQFFLHEELASAPPKHVGPQCSIGTNASISAHFDRRTLELGLPDARLPLLIVHGVQSPLPVESAERTAALVPGAVFEPVDECGHFPWIEQPDAVRRAVERFDKS